MRILQLISTLTGGGAERQLEYLSRELLRRGHDVCVGYVYRGLGPWPDGIPLRHICPHAGEHPLCVAAICGLIRARDPHVVQTWTLGMDVAGGLAAALTGVPWLVREPSTEAQYAADYPSRLRLRVVRQWADAVVANSSAGRRYWTAHAPRLPAIVIRNAVPVETIEATAPVARGDERAVGVFVGRLQPAKNVDVLLRAGAAVMAQREMTLVVCGDGPERDRLTRLAADLGIAGRVRFTGFVPDVWRYVRGADFSALLSDFEGEPNAAMESFAAGTPAILSDISAHRELAADGAAMIVPLRDVEATARAIRAMLDEPATAAAQARIARASMGRRSIGTVASAFERLYAVLTACAPGSPRPRRRDRRIAVSRECDTGGDRCG